MSNDLNGWPATSGCDIAALLTIDGPEKNTIQHAEDGLNFEIMLVIRGAPEAMGLYRTQETDESLLQARNWGLCHFYRDGWQCIRRFETYYPRHV